MLINVFGLGEVFKQLKPLLEEQNHDIKCAVDDTISDSADEILLKDNKDVLYCVGYKYMEKRLSRFYELENKGIKFMKFIASNAIVSDHVVIGQGCIVNQGVIIDNFVSIGKACFLNIGCTISHDTNIGDGVFVAPGATIAGFVTIGQKCFIGANSTIINNINIGKNVIIAAGAVVINDIPDNVMIAGNPAIIKKYL